MQEIWDLGHRSISVIGMGKNTGKTFTFNQLVVEARQLGLRVALTSIGLDGEERDSLFRHEKPKIMLRPGEIVVNAKVPLLESGLDYEILATTGIMTPLGEVILARVLSGGKTFLAGPSSRNELAFVRNQLQSCGLDLFLVDGAIDRRSLAAPMVTDTAVLAVGAEAAWDRKLLLEKLRVQLGILRLPVWDGGSPELRLQLGQMGQETKLVTVSPQGIQGIVTQGELTHHPQVLASQIHQGTFAVFVRGMLTDDILVKILASGSPQTSLTLLVSDPTNVFLGKQSFQRLQAQNMVLKVLDPIHVSAVTVNPFHSGYGWADPLALLDDVGQAVEPIPTYDLNLGIRYRPKKEDVDAISRS